MGSLYSEPRLYFNDKFGKLERDASQYTHGPVLRETKALPDWPSKNWLQKPLLLVTLDSVLVFYEKAVSLPKQLLNYIISINELICTKTAKF